MLLPTYLNEKVNRLYADIKNEKLKDIQQNLTFKYKNRTGESKSLIGGKNDSILYAISRMPATFSVIYTLLTDLKNEGKIQEVNSVFDIGSGTGAGYFAVREIFGDLDIELFERDENMIDTFSKLSDENVNINKIDLIKQNIESKNLKTADFVFSSYVLSEMTESDRNKVFKKILDASNKYVLIIDTGTPKTFQEMMKLKSIAKQNGYNVVAPCNVDVCPLQGDYCQFFARVERSSLLRQAKNGNLSYEDEKYFYLLFEKNIGKDFEFNSNSERVIRRPKIRTNEIEIKVCSRNGVVTKIVTKKDKEFFKKCKKIKINQSI